MNIDGDIVEVVAGAKRGISAQTLARKVAKRQLVPLPAVQREIRRALERGRVKLGAGLRLYSGENA